ncbi:hypothetical protein ACT3UJ_06340 [Halomonas sp. 86]|uniref:hypothetical protein n=1 Tax=unclassified Halomonas TaxID=2609666 RepID=UPI0040347CA0
MYQIREFGNDRECPSIAALQETLRREYAGKSVSVLYCARATGMRRVHYVDVQADGTVIESYGDQAPVDFSVMDTARVG